MRRIVFSSVMCVCLRSVSKLTRKKLTDGFRRIFARTLQRQFTRRTLRDMLMLKIRKSSSSYNGSVGSNKRQENRMLSQAINRAMQQLTRISN